MVPGQGRVLRQLMAQLCKTLEKEIPHRLEGADFKAEKEHIEKAYKVQEAKAYAQLDAFGEARHFALYRENGHLVFTLLGDKGRALTEVEARSLPHERRAKIDQAEEELRAEISRFLDQTRPLERAMNERLLELRRQFVKPLLDQELSAIRTQLEGLSLDGPTLSAYLDLLMADVLDKLGLFTPSDADEALRLDELDAVLANYGVNVLVDNAAMTGAPALVDNNPTFRSLFGSIEYQPEEDVLRTDFSRIRAGTLHKASGGFLMLHLRDLLTDDQGGLCRALHGRCHHLPFVSGLNQSHLPASGLAALQQRLGSAFAGGVAPRSGRPSMPKRHFCPHGGAGGGECRRVPGTQRSAG